MLIDGEFIVAVGVIIYLLFRALFLFVKRKSGKYFRWQAEILKMLFWIYIFMVVSVTMFPLIIEPDFSGRDLAQAINFIPLISIIREMGQIGVAYGGDTLFTIELIARNVGGNILLLMPLGFFAPLLWGRFRSLKNVFLLCLVVSLSIELLQLVEIIAGVGALRAVDIDDCICNVFGALLGFLIFKLVKVLWDKVGNASASERWQGKIVNK